MSEAPSAGSPAALPATRLDLRGRGLHSVPPEVFEQAQTLEVLDLSSNAFDHLPDALAELPRLEVIFCSDNRFTALPEVLGRCPALEMVGFKANRIASVTDAALPARLRWLILTDNALTALPAGIGRCHRLQKLMLAGNRLNHLPESLAACERLELLRIAANDFGAIDAALPPWLLALPQLRWIAFAGNPFCDPWEAQSSAARPMAGIPWTALRLGEQLGEGASGVIHAATWSQPGRADQAVAVKLFKGSITSDGLPRSEMAACLAVGDHPNLVAVEGRIAGHSQGLQGLVLRRIPAGHRNLAGPPSFESCTRDVYPPGARLDAAQARRIGEGVASALAQLHGQGVLHGDLYAHNILVGEDGEPLLGDFGAASFLPPLEQVRREALIALDQRALALLRAELAALAAEDGPLTPPRAAPWSRCRQ